jgi:hypothetical protein
MSSPFTVRADETSQFEKIDPSYYETDVNSLIGVASAADIAAKRRALIRYIWGGKGFPAEKLPAEVKQDIKDERYAELFSTNLKQIDRLTINMDYGLESVIYHFIPKTPINKLIIYHQGHRGDFIQGIDTIRAFIEKGCAVMAISMPLLGMNSQPVVNLERFGKFHVTKHIHLRLLENPINYFVEPIAVAINYAGKFEYDHISMIGISGQAQLSGRRQPAHLFEVRLKKRLGRLRADTPRPVQHRQLPRTLYNGLIRRRSAAGPDIKQVRLLLLCRNQVSNL